MANLWFVAIANSALDTGVRSVTRENAKPGHPRTSHVRKTIRWNGRLHTDKFPDGQPCMPHWAGCFKRALYRGLAEAYKQYWQLCLYIAGLPRTINGFQELGIPDWKATAELS